MTRIETGLAIAVSAMCLLVAACGNQKDYGAEVSMGVQGDGLIIPTSTQSCTDKKDGNGDRSVSKNAMVFSNFSLQYTGQNKALFIGAMKIKVTSPAVTSGVQIIEIGSEEIGNLLGITGQTLYMPSGSLSYTVNSNSSSRPATYPACPLAVGGIQLSDGSITSFTANVEISLVGSASNTLTGDVERVEKTISARATY